MPTSTVTLSLNSAISWGKVSEAQVKAAVGDPAELPAETRMELKSLLTTSGDSFEPAARAALEAALASPEKTRQPSLASWLEFKKQDTKGISYQPVANGSLFVDGPSSDDVQQGNLGDCYLLSTLAGLAHTNPKALTDAVTDNHNGTYTVRFFQRDDLYGSGQPQPVYVTVDDKLPTRNNFEVYARTPAGELWPAIIEKAYAQFKGGYGHIGSGGLPGDAAFDLTGDAGSMRLVALTSADKTYSRIEKALGKGQAVMATTIPEQLRSKHMKLDGLPGMHAYSINRVYEQDGQKYVEIRNPWGYEPIISTPRGPIGSSRGTFSLTIDEFKAGFPFAFIAD